MLSTMKTLLLILLVASSDADVPMFNFTGCAATDYYASLGDNVSAWTKEDLAALTQSNRRATLPTIPMDAGQVSVRGALTVLDPGTEPETVRTIWSQENLNNSDAGSQFGGWRDALMWPIGRGASKETN